MLHCAIIFARIASLLGFAAIAGWAKDCGCVTRGCRYSGNCQPAFSWKGLIE